MFVTCRRVRLGALQSSCGKAVTGDGARSSEKKMGAGCRQAALSSDWETFGLMYVMSPRGLLHECSRWTTRLFATFRSVSSVATVWQGRRRMSAPQLPCWKWRRREKLTLRVYWPGADLRNR